MSEHEQENQLVEMGMGIVRAMLDVDEGRQLTAEALEVIEQPGAQYVNRRGATNPHRAVRRYVVFHHPAYVAGLYRAIEAEREQHRQMEEALRLVDAQVPDAIGGENYLISPGALYAVKAALDGRSREPSSATAEEGGLG